MKKLLVFFIGFSISCGGTTGHIVFYNFNHSKMVVEHDLRGIINSDSSFQVPADFAPSKVDIFELYYIKFNSPPKEIYRLGFTDSTSWRTSPTSQLGFVGVFDGDSWKVESELSNSEKKRIQERLEREILSKLSYQYYKTE